VSEDWGAAAADVAAGLADAGQTVTVHQPATDGSFNSATDTTTGASSPQDHVVSAVEDDYSAFSVASGVVAAGDVKLLVSAVKLNGAAMPLPVADLWTVTLGGKRWAIKKVDRIAPGGTTVMYELQLRGVG